MQTIQRSSLHHLLCDIVTEAFFLFVCNAVTVYLPIHSNSHIGGKR